jgi:hypothetical protein
MFDLRRIGVNDIDRDGLTRQQAVMPLMRDGFGAGQA